MAAETVFELPKGGFDFSNCLRNSYFSSKGFVAPKIKKTGTTIVGVVFRDGIVLGADTRATEGNIVADKNCSKIHYMAPNMYCCGAGTAADTFSVTNMVSSQLELHRLATDREVPVSTACTLLKQHLFRYQGHISAALVLGGYDLNGPCLYEIHPHGSTSKLPFVTMGSGSLAAMAVLESGFKLDMTVDEAKKLVRDAIASGIFNDLGSGSNVDLCIIDKDGANLIRTYEEANVKGKLKGRYHYKVGTTAVLTSKVIPLEVVEETVKQVEEMDVSG